MKTKLAVIAGLAAVLTVGPVGLTGSASACPDPDNPCDIQPYELIPQSQWCKIDPRC